MPKASDLLKVAPRYLGTPYSKMDCQAFVERCLMDIGIDDNLPGSNAWYRRMTWVGTPEECKRSFGKIPPGAFLYILKQDGKEPEKYKSDGIGNASHIGIYTDMSCRELCELVGIPYEARFDFGSGAVNSSSTHACVCTSKFAGKAISCGWNRIGLWDALSYEMEFPTGDTYGGEIVTATVWAPGGATVNMRIKPSTSSALVDQVPIGAVVQVIQDGPEWSEIEWKSKRGYMMTKYIKKSDAEGETVTVTRSWLLGIYNEIGEKLCLQQTSLK